MYAGHVFVNAELLQSELALLKFNPASDELTRLQILPLVKDLTKDFAVLSLLIEPTIETDFAEASQAVRGELAQPLVDYEPSALSLAMSVARDVAGSTMVSINESQLLDEADSASWPVLLDEKFDLKALDTFAALLQKTFAKYGNSLMEMANLVQSELAMFSRDAGGTPRNREFQRVCNGLSKSERQIADFLFASFAILSREEILDYLNNISKAVTADTVGTYIKRIRHHWRTIKPEPDCYVDGDAKCGWKIKWKNL